MRKVVYIFESGGSPLLHLSRLPIRSELEESLLAHIELFRRLAAGDRVDPTQAAVLPEALVLTAREHVVLSEWGYVVWAAVAGSAKRSASS